MKILSLIKTEEDALKIMIDREIESFKSKTNLASPFHIADVVSIFRKLTLANVIDGFPATPMKPEVISPLPKPKEPVKEVIVADNPKEVVPVNPDTIDKMADYLLPPDSLDEEIEVQKITKGK